MPHTHISRLLALALFVCATATLVRADGGANHQVRNLHFGVSGGNINDRSKAFCCSGTLGAMVTSGGVQYALSNNHVLARAGAAVAGEDVSQPGLIDNGCRVPPIVADFATAAPLGSNVDAALAALRPGTMDPTGFIEDIGVPSDITVAPAVGLAVIKSGRTTGATSGTVSSINTAVNVRYQQGCNQGKKFVVSYTDQVVITPGSFSAGGDSGSLIVTNDANHNPVALLFAGSSSSTIGNPIGEVLTKLSAAAGAPVGFGPTGGLATALQTSAISESELSRGEAARAAHAPELMRDPTIFGVGVGADPAQPGAAAVVIYIERGRGRANIPNQLDGVRTVIVETDPFVAYGWNMQPEANVCIPQ